MRCMLRTSQRAMCLLCLQCHGERVMPVLCVLRLRQLLTVVGGGGLEGCRQLTRQRAVLLAQQALLLLLLPLLLVLLLLLMIGGCLRWLQWSHMERETAACLERQPSHMPTPGSTATADPGSATCH